MLTFTIENILQSFELYNYYNHKVTILMEIYRGIFSGSSNHRLLAHWHQFL